MYIDSLLEMKLWGLFGEIFIICLGPPVGEKLGSNVHKFRNNKSGSVQIYPRTKTASVEVRAVNSFQTQ